MKGNNLVGQAVMLAVVLGALAFGAPGRTAEAARSPGETGTGTYSVEFWSEAQGLPQSRIRAILQSRDGYLWLGADRGLARFDGVSFTMFNRGRGNLRDNEVWALEEDRSGGLWIGTGGGLTLYKDGSFRTFTKADGMPDDWVRSIDVDPDGNIWIACASGAARWADGRFTAFTTREGLTNNMPIRVCARSSLGVLLVAGNEVDRFVDGRFVAIDGLVAEKDGRVNNLTAGSDGAFWLTFENGLVKRVRNGEVTVYRLSDGVPSRFPTVFDDAHGNVWLTSRDGLFRLTNGEFRPVLSADVTRRLGTIYWLCQDREGSLWLGLEANGLARLRLSRVSVFTTDLGLPSDSMRSVFQDSRGDIWIGTNVGLSRWSQGRITNYGEAEGLPVTSVSAVGEDKDGIVWAASGGDLYQMRNGRAVRDANWRHVYDIKTIYRDWKNRLWVGTASEGLYLYETDHWTVFRVKDGLASDQVRGIVLDRTGALWIGTLGSGVSRYADGKFTTFTEKDGLANDRLAAAYEDDEGVLWFSTRTGLSRYADGRFTTFRTSDGLFTDYVSNMLDDGAGSFWFGSDHGLFTVPKADFSDFIAGRIHGVRSQSFGLRDGLLSLAFVAGSQPNAWRTTDGRLFFCSLKGLAMVEAGRTARNTMVPPVHVESILIDKRGYRPGQAVKVPPGAGEVEIHYTALSLIAPEKVVFKYRLVGFDRDWVEAGTRRFAYYTNLAPGSYRFQVVACNNDGLWNETGDAFAFTLTPYFYQRGWFYALGLLTLVGLIGAVYELRLIGLKVRERELQARVAEAVARVRVLSGMLPICASCKKVRDDKGYWNQIETYIREHSDTQISHGLCPECVRRLYPEFSDDLLPPDDAATPPPEPRPGR
jgi:ligand-binding sensor domain-containing protein